MGVIERHNACKFLTIKLGNVYGAMGLAGNIVCEAGANFCSNRMELSWKKKTGWDDGWNDAGTIYTPSKDTINPAINNGTYRNYRYNYGERELTTFKNDNCRDAFANDWIGFQLAQWTYPSRKYELYDFCTRWCKEHNKPFEIGNLEMGLDFIIYELQTSHKTTYSVLLNAIDIIVPSNFVCINYERPQGFNTAEVQRTRAQMGFNLFAEVFKSKPTQWFRYKDKWYVMYDGIVKFDKWVEYNSNWYHMGTDGAMEVNKWLLYDHKWYYVGADGACVKDTYINWNNQDYYINQDGIMEE